MGTYDQLSKINKTPPVAAPEPVKTVEVVSSQPMEVSQPAPTVTKPTAPRRETKRTEANPKLMLDRQPFRQRIITRASFEVYQDQIQVLREVSLNAKLGGQQLSISEMVREALDNYLTDKNLNK